MTDEEFIALAKSLNIESEVCVYQEWRDDFAPNPFVHQMLTKAMERQPVGYINERTLSIIKSGSVCCTHISPKQTEFQQIALYAEPK